MNITISKLLKRTILEISTSNEVLNTLTFLKIKNNKIKSRKDQTKRKMGKMKLRKRAMTKMRMKIMRKIKKKRKKSQNNQRKVYLIKGMKQTNFLIQQRILHLQLEMNMSPRMMKIQKKNNYLKKNNHNRFSQKIRINFLLTSNQLIKKKTLLRDSIQKTNQFTKEDMIHIHLRLVFPLIQARKNKK